MDFDTKPKHAAPDNQTSSQGCQNIPISIYLQFIQNIKNNMNDQEQDVSYMLLDASKVKPLDGFERLKILQKICSRKLKHN